MLQKIDLHFLAPSLKLIKTFFHSVLTVYCAPAILRPIALFTTMMPVLGVNGGTAERASVLDR